MTPEKLVELAKEAMTKAYAPYSGFMVGAALLCKDGTVYQGCNIENAAYGPTNCAERTAFFKAIYDGHRDFTAIAVCGGKDGVISGAFPPCGICRQVMRRPPPWRIFCPSVSLPRNICKPDVDKRPKTPIKLRKPVDFFKQMCNNELGM